MANDANEFFMSDAVPEAIPYGFCLCGCGLKTTIATRNQTRFGWVKGQPKAFVRGHKSRPPLDLRGPFKIGKEVACLLGLSRGYFTIVSVSDIARLREWRWWAHIDPKSNAVYAVGARNIGSKRIRCQMSRFLLGVDDDVEVDHQNGITLWNLPSNLRPSTRGQNQMNSGGWKHTSRFKGVCWHKSAKKWFAQISCNKVKYRLGFSSDEMWPLVCTTKRLSAYMVNLQG